MAGLKQLKPVRQFQLTAKLAIVPSRIAEPSVPKPRAACLWLFFQARINIRKRLEVMPNEIQRSHLRHSPCESPRRRSLPRTRLREIESGGPARIDLQKKKP